MKSIHYENININDKNKLNKAIDQYYKLKKLTIKKSNSFYSYILLLIENIKLYFTKKELLLFHVNGLSDFNSINTLTMRNNFDKKFGTGFKPQGENPIWACLDAKIPDNNSYNASSRTYSWIEFCIGNDMCQNIVGNNTEYYAIIIKTDKCLVVDTIIKLLLFVYNYGNKYGYINWTNVASRYDAVHFLWFPELKYKKRFLWMYSFDVQSTIIFHKDCITAVTILNDTI